MLEEISTIEETSDDETTQDVDTQDETTQEIEPQEVETEEPQDDEEETTEESETETDEKTETNETLEQKIERLEKIAKDNQSSYTKMSQEKAELEKKLAQKEQVFLNPKEVENELINAKAQELAMAELQEYRNALYSLDPKLQPKVTNLLNAYQATGNVDYFIEAQNKFSPSFVSKVTQLKSEMAFQARQEILEKQSEQRATAQTKYYQNLQAHCPTVMKYIDEKSDNFCKPIADYTADLYRFTDGNIDVSLIEQSISQLEKQIIDNYKKQTNLNKAIQKEKAGLTAPKSKTKAKTIAKDVDLTQLSEAELAEYYDKNY